MVSVLLTITKMSLETLAIAVSQLLGSSLLVIQITVSLFRYIYIYMYIYMRNPKEHERECDSYARGPFSILIMGILFFFVYLCWDEAVQNATTVLLALL